MAHERDIDWPAEEQKLLSAHAELKSKFEFYVVTIPFLSLGMAISSFDINESHLIGLEVLAWGLFLLSGLFGIGGKLTELELLSAHLTRVRKKITLREVPEIHREQIIKDTKLTNPEINQGRNYKRIVQYNTGLLILLVLGYVALIMSRAIWGMY